MLARSGAGHLAVPDESLVEGVFEVVAIDVDPPVDNRFHEIHHVTPRR
ncbi:hypothetical protein [Micromonospora aurantiaca (nom. illeg.)]